MSYSVTVRAFDHTKVMRIEASSRAEAIRIAKRACRIAIEVQLVR